MLLISTVNWIKKDKKYRKEFFKFEIKKLIIKSILFNNKHFFFDKIYYDNIFKKFSHNSSISRSRTNCMFLGNSRSIFQKFKMSRHICKKFASHGLLTGLKKSSF